MPEGCRGVPGRQLRQHLPEVSYSLSMYSMLGRAGKGRGLTENCKNRAYTPKYLKVYGLKVSALQPPRREERRD